MLTQFLSVSRRFEGSSETVLGIDAARFVVTAIGILHRLVFGHVGVPRHDQYQDEQQ